MPSPLSIITSIAPELASFSPSDEAVAVTTRLSVIEIAGSIMGSATDYMKRPATPVSIGHGFVPVYDRLINPAAYADEHIQPKSEYSQDLERHMRAQALQPATLEPSASVREISSLPSGHTILDDEVVPLNDAAIDRMSADIQNAPVVSIYPSGLDADAIRQAVYVSSTPLGDARADLAQAA